MAPSMRASRTSPAWTSSPARLWRENSFSAMVRPMSCPGRRRGVFRKQHLHPFLAGVLHVQAGRRRCCRRVALADRREQRRMLPRRLGGAMREAHLARAEQPHGIVDGVEALGEKAVVRAAVYSVVEASIVPDQLIAIAAQV